MGYGLLRARPTILNADRADTDRPAVGTIASAHPASLTEYRARRSVRPDRGEATDAEIDHARFARRGDHPPASCVRGRRSQWRRRWWTWRRPWPRLSRSRPCSPSRGHRRWRRVVVGTRPVVVVLPAALLRVPSDRDGGGAAGLHRAAACASRTVLVLLPADWRLLPERPGLRGAVDQGRAESGVSGAAKVDHSLARVNRTGWRRQIRCRTVQQRPV
jgi:hypothetical protein